MITSIACHSAIKAHDPLTMEKMQYLLDELRARNTPLTCPHGRPIVLRIPDKDIEKNFLRS
jgi:DNA mismatch repair protein MutL